MSDPQEPQAEALSLDEIARAVAELASRAEASRVAAGFLELVQRWAAPSAVLTAVRDPAATAGWRLVPSLCAGSLTLGVERTLARLVEDTPECLARPSVLRGEEVPGVRVRDNVVVPWWCEGDSGLLVLRGVPRPSRAGLGEALALAGAAVWPRLLGAPAARIEALLRELSAAAARLDSEAGRQLERLQAAAPPLADPPDAALETRIGELEAELHALEKARDALARERETAGLDLAAARQQAENTGRELDAAREDRRSVERELEVARQALASLKAEAGGPEPKPPGTGASSAAEPMSADNAPASESARGALRTAVTAVRRAAFVPPMLRVSIEEVAALASPEPRPARRLGVALLDRDVVSLESVAAELEATGIEVRLANQPEELSLLLRSPDAAAVDALVCDVMSFRPDQNVAGILRHWDKSRAGLVVYLSYDPQSPAELERARRTPMSLTAGHIPRPLAGARLGDAFDILAKKLGKTP